MLRILTKTLLKIAFKRILQTSELNLLSNKLINFCNQSKYGIKHNF